MDKLLSLSFNHLVEQFPAVINNVNQFEIFEVSPTPLSNAKILMDTSLLNNYCGTIVNVNQSEEERFQIDEKQELESIKERFNRDCFDNMNSILRHCLNYLDSIQKPEEVASISLNELALMRQKVGDDSILIMDKLTKYHLFGTLPQENTFDQLFDIDSTTYDIPIVSLKRNTGYFLPETVRYVYLIKKNLFKTYFYPLGLSEQKHLLNDVEISEFMNPIIVDVEIQGYDYSYGQFVPQNKHNFMFASYQKI